MQRCRLTKWAGGLGFCAFLMVWLAWQPPASGQSEEKFPVLQVGTHTYRNVTVTTKNKNYVFLLHADGMTNLKVSDLSPELRDKLGYAPPTPTNAPATNAPLAVAKNWAKQTLAKVDNPQLRSFQSQMTDAWHRAATAGEQRMPALNGRALAILGGVLLVFYLFWCYCVKLICEKTGKEPGVLVWVPLLQHIPLLRAAGMSGWWFLALFIPLLNLVAGLLWCVKITEARNKNGLFALLLILPVTNILAFLYLAFGSADAPPRKTERRTSLMTLETA